MSLGDLSYWRCDVDLWRQCVINVMMCHNVWYMFLGMQFWSFFIVFCWSGNSFQVPKASSRPTCIVWCIKCIMVKAGGNEIHRKSDLLSRPLKKNSRPRPWSPGLEIKTKTLAHRRRPGAEFWGTETNFADQDFCITFSRPKFLMTFF